MKQLCCINFDSALELAVMMLRCVVKPKSGSIFGREVTKCFKLFHLSLIQPPGTREWERLSNYMFFAMKS